MPLESKLTVAILVISETASRDVSTDKCIPVLKEVLEKDGNDQWQIAETKIVRDDVLDIQRAVTQWTDNHSSVNLIVTSGGTGFAVKDVTPEVGQRQVRSYTCNTGYLWKVNRQLIPLYIAMRQVLCMYRSLSLQGSTISTDVLQAMACWHRLFRLPLVWLHDSLIHILPLTHA